MPGVRLRQIALVGQDIDWSVDTLRAIFDVPVSFRDPGIVPQFVRLSFPAPFPPACSVPPRRGSWTSGAGGSCCHPNETRAPPHYEERASFVYPFLPRKLFVDDVPHTFQRRQGGMFNALLGFGDTFLEIVSPTDNGYVEDSSAAKILRKQGGDCGYMAIFGVDDLAHTSQVQPIPHHNGLDYGDVSDRLHVIPGRLQARTRRYIVRVRDWG